MPHPYSGEVFPKLPFPLRFSDPGVTFAIGGNPNIFGHALFRFGRDIGYIHVDEVHNFPKLLPAADLPRYLRDNDKRLFRHEAIAIPNPEAALRHIDMVRREKWWWLGIPHNCVCFCEEILQAGGTDWEQISNLPEIISMFSPTPARPLPLPEASIGLTGPSDLAEGEQAEFTVDLQRLQSGGQFTWSHRVGEEKDGLYIVGMSYGRVRIEARSSSGTGTLYVSYRSGGVAGSTSTEIRFRPTGWRPPATGTIALTGPAAMARDQQADFTVDLKAAPRGGEFSWSHRMGEEKDGLRLIRMSYGVVTMEARSNSGTGSVSVTYRVGGTSYSASAKVGFRPHR